MTLLEPVLHYLMTCGKRTVTLGEAVAATERTRRQVLRVMDKLTREGYLVQVRDQPVPPRYGEVGPPRRNPTWRIVGDLSGRPKPNPPRPASIRSRIWRAVRARRRFTKAELAVIADASMATVDEYVRLLERAGYLRRTGHDNRRVVYLLTKPNQVEQPRGLGTHGGGAS